MSSAAARVLLVEDNIDDARLIVSTLKRTYPAIELKHVHDGAEALDCIFGTGQYSAHGDHYTPDLVILDLSLPKVSGQEVLRIIRSYARTRLIPVVILSSATEAPVILDTYERGASSYIHKAQNPRQFREAVQAIASYWLGVNEGQSQLDPKDITDSAAS
jgi:two-component system, response regulator